MPKGLSLKPLFFSGAFRPVLPLVLWRSKRPEIEFLGLAVACLRRAADTEPGMWPSFTDCFRLLCPSTLPLLVTVFLKFNFGCPHCRAVVENCYNNRVGSTGTPVDGERRTKECKWVQSRFSMATSSLSHQVYWWRYFIEQTFLSQMFGWFGFQRAVRLY